MQQSRREGTLLKRKSLKISHWEQTYDTENNKLGEIVGEELADLTENNAAEQTPGSIWYRLLSKVFYAPKNKTSGSSVSLHCKLGKFR